MNQIAPKNAVMCVDVGNNAYSFGRYFESQEHNFLMSGYLGSIGFAFPAAMEPGPQLATAAPSLPLPETEASANTWQN